MTKIVRTPVPQLKVKLQQAYASMSNAHWELTQLMAKMEEGENPIKLYNRVNYLRIQLVQAMQELCK